MKLHPLLNDPQAVLVSHTPVSDPVGWDAYRAAAREAMSAMQIELDGEKAVIKPNVTVGEKYADPDTGIGTHPGFVHGMFDHLVEHGGRRSAVYVLEDPRNADDNAPRHWRGTGYDTLAQDTGIKLRCPTTYTCVKKQVPQHQAHPTLNVSRLAVGAEYRPLQRPQAQDAQPGDHDPLPEEHDGRGQRARPALLRSSLGGDSAGVA